jgi:3-deoxy-D-manno-octulosonic-acid transferase
MLLDSGAASQVGNADELGAALLRLCNDAAQRKRMGGAGMHIVAANRGSVAALLELIEPLLEQGPAAYR